jgi:hypothetical protein
MNNRGFSAYNLARGALLNSKLTLADSGNQPLKLLDIVVSGMGMDPTAGLWLSPLRAVPAVPRVFPFDLIYLDKEYRVLDTAEMGPGIEFPAFHPGVSSALVLPSDTLHRTHTAPGDHLIVCACNELEALLRTSSLPSPDGAEPVNRPVAASPRTASEPDKPGFIELTPERPLVPSAPSTAFEQSVLTAIAKVAEARNIHEPRPVSTNREIAAQGPSMALTEAVFDSARTMQAPVVEHRIDPEDLFSNWVGTAPPIAPAPRNAPPKPPPPSKSLVPAQEAAPEPARQNGRKSSASSKPAADTPGSSRASTDSIAAKGQSRTKPAPATTDKYGALSKSKSGPSMKADEPKPNEYKADDESIHTRTPVPQSHPATTFTSAPYGMWQISMPTGVASMASAKSPEPPVKTPAPAKGTDSAQAEVAKAQLAAPASVKRSEAPIQREAQNPPLRPAPVSRLKAESVAVTEQIVNPPKPALRDTSSSEVHAPGDFLASLQEKLQRVQQSRPVPLTETAPEAQIASPRTSSSVPPPSSPPVPAAKAPTATDRLALEKTGAAPGLKSKAEQSPAPSKSKAEPSSGGLRSKLKQWLHPTSSPSDRRRASRRYVPGMVAHYFTGGAPKPKSVADVSMSGIYLLTDDRWMPGTLIQMTLQKPCAYGEKKQSINVLSRIVRRGSDGVAAEFIMPEALSHISHDIQPSQATDKFALARFI